MAKARASSVNESLKTTRVFPNTRPNPQKFSKRKFERQMKIMQKLQQPESALNYMKSAARRVYRKYKVPFLCFGCVARDGTIFSNKKGLPAKEKWRVSRFPIPKTTAAEEDLELACKLAVKCQYALYSLEKGNLRSSLIHYGNAVGYFIMLEVLRSKKTIITGYQSSVSVSAGGRKNADQRRRDLASRNKRIQDLYKNKKVTNPTQSDNSIFANIAKNLPFSLSIKTIRRICKPK